MDVNSPLFAEDVAYVCGWKELLQAMANPLCKPNIFGAVLSMQQ